MVRLIGFLVLLVLGTGGVLAVDFNNAQRAAVAAEGEPVAFADYMQERVAGLTALAGGGAASGLPRGLEAMLPQPPEGWTMRPATGEDAVGFLPRGRRDAPEESVAMVAAVAQPQGGRGVESVAVAYERGDRLVLVQLTRHPDSVFTDPAQLAWRSELQLSSPAHSATPFMTVRGLDVVEDLLPENLRARYFMANVAGQMQLRVVAPERMRDRDLLPFFQTLNVAAMNAGVVDRQPGLGEVPVLVLASALEGETRTAYDADVSRRTTALTTRVTAKLAEAEARAAAAAAASPPKEQSVGFFASLFGTSTEAETAVEPASQIECSEGVGGTKRCAVVPVAAD